MENLVADVADDAAAVVDAEASNGGAAAETETEPEAEATAKTTKEGTEDV